MAANPYKISRPVPRDPAEEFVHDPLFSIDRRHNALDINPRANNYVRVVSNDDPWRSAIELGAAVTLGRLPEALGVAVNSAAIRSTLRASSRGEGRSRFR